MKLAACVAAAAAALAGCAPDFRGASRMLAQDLPAAREPVLDRRRSYFANDLFRPHRDWCVLLYPDGRIVPHGRDTSWFEDGQLEYEREFDHGEPTGRWRSWYASGSPRSEADFGGAHLAPMRWWHANGQLSSDGLALGGVRDGEWTQWHSNGQMAAQGRYRLGLKEGPWSFWNEDGSLAERVEFRDDLRAGPVGDAAVEDRAP